MISKKLFIQRTQKATKSLTQKNKENTLPMIFDTAMLIGMFVDDRCFEAISFNVQQKTIYGNFFGPCSLRVSSSLGKLAEKRSSISHQPTMNLPN